PGSESALAHAHFPEAIAFEGVDLGTYAGVLRRARLVVANDTGPAHIAAAVGAPLLSVLGPTDPVRHRPRGARVNVVQPQPWPTLGQVTAVARRRLADAYPPAG